MTPLKRDGVTVAFSLPLRCTSRQFDRAIDRAGEIFYQTRIVKRPSELIIASGRAFNSRAQACCEHAPNKHTPNRNPISKEDAEALVSRERARPERRR